MRRQKPERAAAHTPGFTIVPCTDQQPFEDTSLTSSAAHPDHRHMRERALVALIDRIARGDQQALGALYDATSTSIYGLVRRILRDEAAAEDVTIEVYMQVFRQATHYDPGRGAPSTWLLTLARSRAIDRLRGETQRQRREMPLDLALMLPSSMLNPEASSTTTELRRVIQRALATLSPEQRQVIEIAYYEGLSHTEIAAKLDKPLGTVKTRLRTGMMVLRRFLEPFYTQNSP